MGSAPVIRRLEIPVGIPVFSAGISPHSWRSARPDPPRRIPAWSLSCFLHRNGLINDPFDIRHFSVIGLIPGKGNHAAGHIPVHKTKTAGANGMLVKGSGVHILSPSRCCGMMPMVK